MKKLSVATATLCFLLAAHARPGCAQAQATSTQSMKTSANAQSALHDSDDIVEPFRVANEAEFFGLMDLSAPDMAQVKAAVEAKDWDAAKQAWATHLENRTNPQWFWSYRDRDLIKRILEEKGQSVSHHVAGADTVLRREFNFVGVPKTLDKSPEWNQGVNDWTSVLNRFYFTVDLGRAYWATGDAKYAQDFSFLIEDWIAKNPVPETVDTFGVFGNPWRALEDGLRVQNWIEGMQLFMDAPQFDAQAKYELTRSLVEHARYMRAVTIRKGYRPGNWQVIEATGLADMGIMLPEFREAAQWRQRAFDTLDLHMQKDVYPDGGHHELTPGYHMVVTDQFLQASLLSQKNGYAVPGLLDRHEKMYEWLMDISKPDRITPSLADSGPHNIESRMADGALLYNRQDMRFLSSAQPPAQWVWTFGPDAFARYAKLVPKKPDFTSVLLPNSKYAMMRNGWNPADQFVLFDMAPWGGGHSHQDRLQVMAYAGRDLLVDPGQYGYDQPLAEYFRSSAAHNIVMVDGQEQPDSDPTVLAWQVTPDADFAAGRIENKEFVHQRSVLWMKPNYWVVVDHVQALGAAAGQQHEVTRLFHFAPTTVAVAGNSARSGFADGMNIQIQVPDGAALEMHKGWNTNGAPAKADEAPVAAYTTHGQLPQTLVTVLTPFSSDAELPKVELLPGPTPQIAHLRLSFASGQQDEIEIAAAPTALQIGDLKGTGRALYLRRGPQSSARAVISDGIGALRLATP